MSWFSNLDFGDILSIASTAASAYGKYEEGKQRDKEAKDRARVEEQNAAMDEERAKDANRRASADAEREDDQRRALIGKQRAAMGASGVAVGEGTFADVLSDTEEQSYEDQETIMLNGMREAYGYTQRADQERRLASNYRRAGKSYKQAGLLSGVGSLIGGTYETGIKSGWWQ